MCLEITLLKSPPHLPGANLLMKSYDKPFDINYSIDDQCFHELGKLENRGNWLSNPHPGEIASWRFQHWSGMVISLLSVPI